MESVRGPGSTASRTLTFLPTTSLTLSLPSPWPLPEHPCPNPWPQGALAVPVLPGRYLLLALVSHPFQTGKGRPDVPVLWFCGCEVQAEPDSDLMQRPRPPPGLTRCHRPRRAPAGSRAVAAARAAMPCTRRCGCGCSQCTAATRAPPPRPRTGPGALRLPPPGSGSGTRCPPSCAAPGSAVTRSALTAQALQAADRPTRPMAGKRADTPLLGFAPDARGCTAAGRALPCNPGLGPFSQPADPALCAIPRQERTLGILCPLKLGLQEKARGARRGGSNEIATPSPPPKLEREEVKPQLHRAERQAGRTGPFPAKEGLSRSKQRMCSQSVWV